MQAIIVDDDIKFAKGIESFVKEYFQNEGELVQIKIYEDGKQLLGELENQQYDTIYLIDIEMPEINGMELAKQMLKYSEDMKIIFLTAYEKYAYPSIKMGVSYFVRKDEYVEQLPILLDRLIREWSKNSELYYIISTATRWEKFAYRDIIYIGKEGKNSVFYCRKNKKYEQRMTLENIYKQLPQSEFIFIERGFIVNMRHIIGLDSSEVRLIDGTKLKISRRYSSIVKDEFAKYVGRIL